MNSAISDTFYTCYKLLFLRYKKISKKAATLISFLQCSVHIFLGHDRDACEKSIEEFYKTISLRTFN